MGALSEYHRLCEERQRVITRNRAARFRGIPAIPVPPKPERPLVPVAYEADGTYYGRLADAADCPPGCVVKMEPAVW